MARKGKNQAQPTNQPVAGGRRSRSRVQQHDFHDLHDTLLPPLLPRLVDTEARRHPAAQPTSTHAPWSRRSRYVLTNIRYTFRVVSGTDTGGGWLVLRVSKTLFPLNASSVRVRGTLAHATRCATRPRCAYADTPSTSSGLATCKGVVCSLTRGFDSRGVCGVPDTTENERTNGQQAS